MLQIEKFIRENDNWEKLLTSPPYNLKIKRDGDYIIFNYNMIKSSMGKRIVQEARGIIFHEPTWKAVCVPFYKFFNYGEGHAAKIDWDTARVLTKQDGSLIKVWYHNRTWHTSTNGMIDAYKAETGNILYPTFGDLFIKALGGEYTIGKTLYNMDVTKTYMFELCTPYNRVVVPHDDFKVYHLATRDMNSLAEEEYIIEGIPKPLSHDAKVLDELDKLPYDEEGYVVVDANYNRIKVKSPAYVAVHHLKSGVDVSRRRVFELVLNGESSEFLTYFPEYTEAFNAIELKWFDYLASVNQDILKISMVNKYSGLGNAFDMPRKQFALMIGANNFTNNGILFKFYGDRKYDWETALRRTPIKKLEEWVLGDKNG